MECYKQGGLKELVGPFKVEVPIEVDVGQAREGRRRVGGVASRSKDPARARGSAPVVVGPVWKLQCSAAR